MAVQTEAQAILAALDGLKRQVEALDDPGRVGLLLKIAEARAEAEAVQARSVSEQSRAQSGVGAPARFHRLR